MARERALDPPRRPAAGGRAGARRPARARDRDAVLAGALQALARATTSTRALALGRDPEGRPVLHQGPPEAHAPGEDVTAALESLREPGDLGAPGVPGPVAAWARAQGVSAAATVASGDGEDDALAVLAIGGPADRPGRVRPRTLAALGACATRLRTPLAATRALERVARLDADVRRLDRLAALGRLTAEVAHEIRNPLVSLKTFLELLPERLDDPEFRTRFLSVVGTEVRRLERLLDSVLDHARPPDAAPAEAGRCRVLPVLESVHRLLAYRASERGVELEVACPEALEASLSRDALTQVVLNLALNAVDATRRGRVRLLADAAAAGVRLRVEDEGRGVPEPLRRRLFEPFVSDRDERAGGLGLAISRRIVEEAGGRIALEPREGRGSAFVVHLPETPSDR